MLKYIFNILLSLDQLINVLFCGDPDETISSRAGKKHKWLAKPIDAIFFFDKRHSEGAQEFDEGPNTVSIEDRWQVYLFWMIILAFYLL